jgi:hypothetical protein
MLCPAKILGVISPFASIAASRVTLRLNHARLA